MLVEPCSAFVLFPLVIALILIFTDSWIVFEAERGAPNANITTNLDAELAAMKEELAALRKLFEEHYQTQ